MAGHSPDVKELDDATFKTTIAQGVWLVDFSAEWCGPCKVLGPIIDKVATSLKGKASVAKIDIDQNQDTTSNYNVMSVPTVVLFVNGVEKDRSVGLRDEAYLTKMITNAMPQ